MPALIRNCEWFFDLSARIFRNFNAISYGCSGSGACHGSHVEGMVVRNLIPVFGVVALLGAGCSGPSGQTGSLTVNLKDGPYADAMAMLVTFSGVSAHHADAEWQPLTFAGGATTLTCDLKKLVNVNDVLGAGQLLAGHYTQIRVVVQSAALYSSPTPATDPACAATMTPPAGLIGNVEIPSGEVKLNRQFTIPEGGATKILLDFDGDRSVNAMGNGRFSMTPVINIVSVE
jgi:Domain of unknown function (DUF4382)